jgi:DNA-binding transcriptional ArsR family regulator
MIALVLDDDRVFKALADPTRRQVLAELRGCELSVGEISARFPVSGPSISRHLRILHVAGLVTKRRDATRILYSLVPDGLAACVVSFLSAVCPEQILRPMVTDAQTYIVCDIREG